jgi:hypothetical protein
MTDKKEIEILIEAGKEAGKQAQEENFLLGLPVCVAENGQIIEIDSKGNKTVILQLEKAGLSNGNK